MKKTTNKRKLVLGKETVKALVEERLRGARGGGLVVGASTFCFVQTIRNCNDIYTFDGCGCSDVNSSCVKTA